MPLGGIFKLKIRSIKACLYPILSIVSALILGGITIKALGFNAVYAYSCLIHGSFGNLNAIGETLIKATPVIFTGLSFAIAQHCGIINLGAEGQLYVGALTGTMVGTSFTGLPAVIHLPLTLAAGFIGGAVFGMIVMMLKNRFHASELITTIMLNYVGIYLSSFFISGPIADKSPGQSFPQSMQIAESAQLPRILAGTRLHAGIFIAALALLFYYIFVWRTTKGFELRVVGMNPTAAEYAGMNIKTNGLLSMFLAGGFAGIGGCIEIIAVQMRLMENFSNNYGFDGIAVALLGNNNPIGIALSGILFGALHSGSGKMEMIAKVPSAVIFMIQGFIILCVVGRSLFGHLHIHKLHRKAEVKEQQQP